jgi:predicted metalloprotease with PDZ domain
VKFILPEEWRIASALASSLDRMVFVAQNYDQFADSPFELGTFRWLGFEARGAKFDVIVDTKLPSIADTDLLSMLKQIVETEMDLMQDQPFSRYTFFYHFPSGHSGGGMEHGCSAAINLGSEELSQGLDLLAALTAHEFFHVWNVKRIRPAALEPIDYTKENFTRALWFSEGVTSLYGSYSLVRSQIETKAAFYQALATVIQDIQSRPARLRQSVEEASLDTWLEKYAYYRRPENSISYYETGEMLGFLLDLTIRQSTRNQRSLDDVLRYLNEEYAMKHRFFDDKKGIPDAVAVIAGRRLDDFFDRYVHGVDEIDYNAFLVMAGLELNHESLPSSDIGFTASRNDDGRWLAEEVTEGGAVATAGLVAGDEILELNGEPASFQLLRRLNTASVPKPFKIKFRHEDRVEEKSLSPGTRASIHYSIVEIPNPSDIQLAIRKGILTGK